MNRVSQKMLVLAHRAATLSVAGHALLIECADPDLAFRLGLGTKTKHLYTVVDNRTIVVPAESDAAFRQAVLGQGLLRLHRGPCDNPRCPVALSVRWPQPPRVPARSCRISDICIHVSDTAVRRQRYARQSRECDIEEPDDMDEPDDMGEV